VHLDLQTRQLFSRAVAELRNPHGVADLHALDVRLYLPYGPVLSKGWNADSCAAVSAPSQTLSTFLIAVLAKKYTNRSSDIIEVLAGLDNVDTIFTDFVGALDSIIRSGRSCQFAREAEAWWSEDEG